MVTSTVSPSLESVQDGCLLRAPASPEAVCQPGPKVREHTVEPGPVPDACASHPLTRNPFHPQEKPQERCQIWARGANVVRVSTWG